MDPWELALLVGVVITAAVSFGDRRALLWLAVGTADFIITTTYAHYVTTPPAAVFQGVFDGAVCALIITYGRYKWERALGFVFQFMVLVSFARMAGLLADRYLYVVTLELANWAALTVIGGTQIMRLAGGNPHRKAMGGAIGGALHRFAMAAFSPRSSFPFWAPDRHG